MQSTCKYNENDSINLVEYLDSTVYIFEEKTGLLIYFSFFAKNYELTKIIIIL